MIQDERASVAPVEIGGDGAVMRPAKAGVDLTLGVAFPPRGELASERTPGGQGARGSKQPPCCARTSNREHVWARSQSTSDGLPTEPTKGRDTHLLGPPERTCYFLLRRLKGPAKGGGGSRRGAADGAEMRNEEDTESCGGGNDLARVSAGRSVWCWLYTGVEPLLAVPLANQRLVIQRAFVGAAGDSAAPTNGHSRGS